MKSTAIIGGGAAGDGCACTGAGMTATVAEAAPPANMPRRDTPISGKSAMKISPADAGCALYRRKNWRPSSGLPSTQIEDNTGEAVQVHAMIGMMS
jgi:hypothetical protein